MPAVVARLALRSPRSRIAASLLLGVAGSTKFTPGVCARAPRRVAIVASTTVLGLALAATFGWLLARASGLSAATATLPTAPGGVSEMSLTAKVLQLGVPVVTSFHVVRVIALLLGGGLLYRTLAPRLGWPHDLRQPVRPEQPGDEDD